MVKTETQKTINEWASKTFGYPTAERSILRMLDEVEELKDIKNVNGPITDSFEEVSNECADILITLYQVANTFGFDLHGAVDSKMKINRARKWKMNGDGTGQHVEE